MIFDSAFKRVRRLFRLLGLLLLFQYCSPVQSRKACASTGVHEFDNIFIIIVMHRPQKEYDVHVLISYIYKLSACDS